MESTISTQELNAAIEDLDTEIAEEIMAADFPVPSCQNGACDSCSGEDDEPPFK